jgi:cell division protein FtsN
MNQSLASDLCLKKILGNTKGFSLRSLLIILLLLVSVFGYLYLFTGLFGNHPKSDGEPVQNVVVKKPMPPRPIQTGEVKTGKTEAVVKQDMKPTIAHPVTSQPAPAHPAIENKSKPGQLLAKATTVKPPVAEPHPNLREKPKPAIPAKSADKEKPVKAGGKSPVKPEKTVAASALKTGKDKFTLLIGVYVLEKSMATEKAKLKAAGLTPVIGKGPKKMEPMTRLFVGEYDSRAQAAEELQKLRKLTSDAFILPGKDKYTVYAGSYFTKGRAESELNRLTKQGITPIIQKTEAPVSTLRLTAGSFTSRKEAEEKSLSLKKHGIKALIVRSGA